MNPEKRLEAFFKYWEEESGKGEVPPLEFVEIDILMAYRDWEISNENISELFGGTKRD